MDISTLSFTAFMVIGAVNIMAHFYPDMDSNRKWIISFAVALLASFVPHSFGNIIADHIREAVAVTLASTGGYKVAQKIGNSI